MVSFMPQPHYPWGKNSLYPLDSKETYKLKALTTSGLDRVNVDSNLPGLGILYVPEVKGFTEKNLIGDRI
jgi:hypothetical protein